MTCGNAVITVRDLRVSVSAVTRGYPPLSVLSRPHDGPAGRVTRGWAVSSRRRMRPPTHVRDSTMRPMARGADDFELDPAVVLIDNGAPSLTFEEWLALVGGDEEVDLGIPAADLLAEARERGEV